MVKKVLILMLIIIIGLTTVYASEEQEEGRLEFNEINDLAWSYEIWETTDSSYLKFDTSNEFW